MSLRDLLAQALEEGCGLDIEAVEASPRYQQILAERWQPITDPDLAVARRAGYADFGGLLHNVPEAQALAQAGSSSESVNPEMEALLQATGELLIVTAAEALPGTLVEVSHRWKAARTADEQIELVKYACARFRQLYDLIKEEPPEDEDQEDTREGVNGQNQLFDWLGVLFKNYPIERVLPLKWGQYPTGPARPNCLGMSIMLVALGWLCETGVMLVSQIGPAEDAMWRGSGTIAQLQLEDLLKQQDESVEHHPFEQFKSDLQNHTEAARSLEHHVMDFHYGAAWQLCDGRWAFIDPYMHSWGIFDEAWELEHHFEILAKYTPALPGLALVATDGGAIERWNADRVKDTRQFIEAAHHLLQYTQELLVRPWMAQEVFQRRSFTDDQGHEDLGTGITVEYFPICDRTISEYMSTMADAQEFYEELAYILAEDPWIGERQRRDRIEMLLLDIYRARSLSDEDYQTWLRGVIEAFAGDGEYRDARLTDLYVYFISFASERHRRLQNAFKEDGQYIHPVLEFSAPAYGIALAVANHIRCWTDDGTPGYDLLDYSSSQIYWHEAVDLSPQGPGESILQHPAIVRAEQMVRELARGTGELDLLHPSSRAKLNFIDNLKETTSEGEEETDGHEECQKSHCGADRARAHT